MLSSAKSICVNVHGLTLLFSKGLHLRCRQVLGTTGIPTCQGARRGSQSSVLPWRSPHDFRFPITTLPIPNKIPPKVRKINHSVLVIMQHEITMGILRGESGSVHFTFGAPFFWALGPARSSGHWTSREPELEPPHLILSSSHRILHSASDILTQP